MLLTEEDNNEQNPLLNKEDKISLLNKEDAINNIFKDCNKCYGGYVFNKLFDRKFIIEKNIFFDLDITISEDSLFVIDYMTKFKNLKTVYNQRKYYHYTSRTNSALREKFNHKKITVIDAYEKILKILEKYPELIKNDNVNINNVRRLYIKSNNNILNQMKKYNYRDKNIEEKLRKNTKKYFNEVLKSSRIGFSYKIDLIINTKFPYIYEKIRKQF